MGPTVASGSRKEPYCTYRLQCTLQNKVTSHGTRTRRACHRKLSSREPPLTLGLTRTALVVLSHISHVLWSHVPCFGAMYRHETKCIHLASTRPPHATVNHGIQVVTSLVASGGSERPYKAHAAARKQYATYMPRYHVDRAGPSVPIMGQDHKTGRHGHAVTHDRCCKRQHVLCGWRG